MPTGSRRLQRPDREQAAALLERLAPALLAFALAEAAVLLMALAVGAKPFDDATWTRFDAALYLQVADGGYELFRCGERFSGYPPDAWCGNAGWFPGFPWVVGLLHLLGAPLGATGLVVATLSTLAALVVLWVFLLDADPTPRNLVVLAFAAFCPGMVYGHAVFPLGPAVLCLVTVLALARRGRWGWAALAGAAAATTYPTVVLGGAVLALWVALDGRADAGAPRPALRARLLAAATLGGGFVAGALLVLVVMWAQTGHLDAYFLIQDKYGHDLRFPVVGSLKLADGVLHGQTGLGAVPGLQALLVLVFAAVALGVVVRDRSLAGIEVAAAGLALVFWAFPASLDAVSAYRSDALLLPAALVLRRVGPLLGSLVAGAAVLLALPMTQAYVQSVLT